MLDVSAAPIRIGGKGTLEINEEGIKASGFGVTGGFINFLMILPVGAAICWYFASWLNQWGFSTFDLITTFSSFFIGLFILAGMFMRPLVLSWKPKTRFFSWGQIEILYPNPKSHKPLVIGVVSKHKRRRVHFLSGGRAYEVEAAIKRHPNYKPTEQF